MQARTGDLTGTSECGAGDGLLRWRMALLNLDVDAVERSDSNAFDELGRRCMGCEFRQPCAVDLRRDATSPVWETYCPNAGRLHALTETWWLSR